MAPDGYVERVTASMQTLLAGRYRLGSLLGRGGMAEVYEALDERLGRPVAVKLLLPAFAAQMGMRDRFEAEARSAARLAHPSVVGVFDAGEDDGMPFIVMERLPGETLADRMGAGPLDLSWLRTMAHDVLGALEAAHAAGVVHRDVKPANILVTADGRAKIADFGIAKALEEVASELTGANQVLGTPAYLAPERLEGLPATPRSDVYSFGVVLYEALAGRKAFPGTTPLGVAHAIHCGEFTPLRQLRPGLGSDLVAAVERAMDRDPAGRFATAADMAAALAPAPVVAGGAGPDATQAIARPEPHAGTVVMPADGGAEAAPSGDTAGRSVPLWARGLSGGLVGPRRRRTLFLVSLIAGLVLVGLVVLAAVAGDAGDAGGSGGTPTTTVPTLVPTTLPELTTTVPATAPLPTANPPAPSPGKGKGKGRG